MNRSILALAPFVLLAACAQPTPVAGVPVPDKLKPEAGQAPLRTLVARGVQIYECRLKRSDPQAAEWAFVAPEADLFDGQGQRVGKHYAGPHWESDDGSKVVGSMKANADAPQAGAIPWLLLTTRSDGKDGVFANVTSIQRINTVGGVAPAAEGCSPASLGKGSRIAYSADYVMFGSK